MFVAAWRASVLPETQVTATSSTSGDATAYSRARLSSMPVSTSRIRAVGRLIGSMLPERLHDHGRDLVRRPPRDVDRQVRHGRERRASRARAGGRGSPRWSRRRPADGRPTRRTGRRGAGRRLQPDDEDIGRPQGVEALRHVGDAGRRRDHRWVRGRQGIEQLAGLASVHPVHALEIAKLTHGQAGRGLDVGVRVAEATSSAGRRRWRRPWTCRPPSGRPSRSGGVSGISGV